MNQPPNSSDHRPEHNNGGPERAERYDDEIDLLGLVRAVLRTWKVWLIALVVVTALYGTYHAMKIAAYSDEVTYSKPLRLTFPGAHNMEFPNGAPFSYGDIIASSVAEQAHERNNLDEYDMSASELQASLAVEPYAPEYPIIVQRYRKRLANSDLSYEQSQALESRMESELRQATQGTVLVSMRLDQAQLPESVASKVLSDIPAIWAERTLRDKGVLNLDVNLATARSLNADLLGEVEYLIVSDLLAEKVELLRENIDKLREFEGSSTISDPETGMRLPDLNNAVSDLNRYVINELMSPIRYLGLSREPELSIYYYRDRLKRLNMELELLESQAELARQAFDSYRQSEPQGSLGGELNSSTMVSQLGGDTIDRLMQLSGESEREEYKQRLNEQWLNYNLQAAEVRSKINDMSKIVKSLEDAANGDGADEETREAYKVYMDRVNERLPEILDQLAGYFDVTQRIYDQVSAEAVGVRDRLYTPMTNAVLEQRAGLDLKSLILVWIALMFLTSVVVIPATMIRNALKSNPGSD